MEFISKHQEQVIKNVLSAVLNDERPNIDADDRKAIMEFIDLIEKEREWERWTIHCNTDCELYRHGMCPFKWNEHSKCPKYRDMIE